MNSEPRTPRHKKVALIFFSSVSAIAIALFILGVAGFFDSPTGHDPKSASTFTTDGTLANQIKGTLLDEDEKLDDFRYADGILSCRINEGEWLTVGPAGLRYHLGDPLRHLYSLASRFPQIRIMEISLEGPAAAKKDQYGNDLPASMALTAYLRIDTADLKSFPESFNWDLYPVYVANRYLPSIDSVNRSLRRIWQSELAEETTLGGFQ